MLVATSATQDLLGLLLGWAETWRCDVSSLLFHWWPWGSALGSRIGETATAETWPPLASPVGLHFNFPPTLQAQPRHCIRFCSQLLVASRALQTYAFLLAYTPQALFVLIKGGPDNY